MWGEGACRPESVDSRNAQTHFGIALERGHQLFLLGRLGLKHNTTTVSSVPIFEEKKVVFRYAHRPERSLSVPVSV